MSWPIVVRWCYLSNVVHPSKMAQYFTEMSHGWWNIWSNPWMWILQWKKYTLEAIINVSLRLLYMIDGYTDYDLYNINWTIYLYIYIIQYLQHTYWYPWESRSWVKGSIPKIPVSISLSVGTGGFKAFVSWFGNRAVFIFSAEEMHFFPLLSVAFSVWRGGDDGVAGERGSATVLGQWLIQTCFEGWLIMCCGNLRPRELTRQKDFVYETHGIFSDATFETSYSISADTPPQTSTNHDRFQPKEPLRIGEKNNRETWREKTVKRKPVKSDSCWRWVFLSVNLWPFEYRELGWVPQFEKYDPISQYWINYKLCQIRYNLRIGLKNLWSGNSSDYRRIYGGYYIMLIPFELLKMVCSIVDNKLFVLSSPFSRTMPWITLNWAHSISSPRCWFPCHVMVSGPMMVYKKRQAKFLQNMSLDAMSRF